MSDDRAGAWLLGETVASGELSVLRLGRAGASVAVVKRLHDHAARDAAVRALFATEAALTCALPPHPRVVRGLGHDLDDARPFLVLEHLDGQDLRGALGTAHPTPMVAATVATAALAVAHLHGCGWVHGDVVPGNLVVGRSGPVLCDLGVVRPIGAGGPVRGTAAYMAPEQVRGGSWTPAVDVFALGVIAWELATGARLFFRGASYLSMAAVVESRPPPLPDPHLAPIVAAALTVDPAGRPTSAELAAALAPLT